MAELELPTKAPTLLYLRMVLNNVASFVGRSLMLARMIALLRVCSDYRKSRDSQTTHVGERKAGEGHSTHGGRHVLAPGCSRHLEVVVRRRIVQTNPVRALFREHCLYHKRTPSLTGEDDSAPVMTRASSGVGDPIGNTVGEDRARSRRGPTQWRARPHIE